MLGLTKESSWNEIFGSKPSVFTAEERKARWQEIKNIYEASGDHEMAKYWEDPGGCVTDEGSCKHKESDQGWCNLQGLPCGYNPVTKILGMACMGAGYEQINYQINNTDMNFFEQLAHTGHVDINLRIMSKDGKLTIGITPGSMLSSQNPINVTGTPAEIDAAFFTEIMGGVAEVSGIQSNLTEAKAAAEKALEQQKKDKKSSEKPKEKPKDKKEKKAPTPEPKKQVQDQDAGIFGALADDQEPEEPESPEEVTDDPADNENSVNPENSTEDADTEN